MVKKKKKHYIYTGKARRYETVVPSKFPLIPTI